MTTLFLDLETYSETPIAAGTHRYAEGGEVLLTALAEDQAPVQVFEGWPTEAHKYLARADRIVIHNSAFDRTFLRVALGVTLPLSKIVDTCALARMHGLPGSLATLCDIFSVPQDQAKDSDGRRLLLKFCKPASNGLRRTKATDPEDWQRFIAYAGRDVEATRYLFSRLPSWNLAGECTLWQLDQRINDRGFLIDAELSYAALALRDRELKALSARTKVLTNSEVQAATQRDAMLKHLLSVYNVDLPDLTKSTLGRRVNDPDLPEPVRELLRIRLETAQVSVAKYAKLLQSVSSDGRLRGALEFCGASRTGRWAGRLFQPQNLPRPKHTQREVDESVAAIKTGVADIVYPDALARAASALRGAIVAPPGHKLVAADLANIEGRVLAWLAGEDWKVQAFQGFDLGSGPDLYALSYSRSFGVPVEDVLANKQTGDGSMRQIGKVAELALGYQGAVRAFSVMAAAYGVDLSHDAVNRVVASWRAAHPAVVAFWPACEKAFASAFRFNGEPQAVGRLVFRRQGAWLNIKLPSGRQLCYASPGVSEGENGRRVLSYMGVNSYSRKWERITTYGGKLVENITQAVSRDILAANMLRIDQAGWPIVLTVHDEVVTEVPARSEYSVKALSALLAEAPLWADGLPLAASGFEAERYQK
jgi:DNA polymerase bacteriophage-type